MTAERFIAALRQGEFSDEMKRKLGESLRRHTERVWLKINSRKGRIRPEFPVVVILAVKQEEPKQSLSQEYSFQ